MAVMTNINNWFRLAGNALADLLYPPCAGCCLCGKETPLTEAGFCFSCRTTILRVSDTACPRCGRPEGIGCCVEPYHIDGAVHGLIYDGAARQAVHKLKYGGGRYLAQPLSQYLADRWPDHWQVDALVPVPLHPVRRRERGFNQAEALAEALSQRVGVPLRLDALTRIKDTHHQTRLTRAQRQRNLSGAFKAGEVKGGRFVLIDDVYTTGATIDACARVLRRAGAREVYAMCLTVRPALHREVKPV